MRRVLQTVWPRVRRYRVESLWMAALFCLGLPSYLRSLLRRQSDRVRETWPGANALEPARDVAVFVHFDRQGHVGRWIEQYLEQLCAAGFAVIFVSNAPRLDADTLDRIRPHAALILRRDNIGHDFGAYRDGLHRIPDLSETRRLVLANDSVFGPLRPVADFVEEMPPDGAAVWGVTDSREGHDHLQSYFLLFHAEALRSQAFAGFWARCRDVQSRYWNILMRELALSRVMAGAGLRCRALCPYRDAVAILAGRDPVGPQPVNPTHDLWRVLVDDMGCPFIKRDLLRDNPTADPDLDRWRDRAAASGVRGLQPGGRQAPDGGTLGGVSGA